MGWRKYKKLRTRRKHYLRAYRKGLKRIPKSKQALKDRTNARRYRREYKQRQKILTILRK